MLAEHDEPRGCYTPIRRVSHLDDDEMAFIFIWHPDVVEKGVSRFAQDHGREELATQPASSARRHRSLNDGDLEIWSRLSEGIGRRQAARARANNDHIGFGISVQVLEVARRHGARDLRLANGGELERIPFAGEVIEELVLVSATAIDSSHSALDTVAQHGLGRHRRIEFVEGGDRWRHLGHETVQKLGRMSTGKGIEGEKHDPSAGIIQSQVQPYDLRTLSCNLSSSSPLSIDRGWITKLARCEHRFMLRQLSCLMVYLDYDVCQPSEGMT